MYALYIYDPLWVFVWFSYPTYWILFFFQKRNCSLSCVVRTFSLVNGVVHCSGFFILMAFHFTYFSLFISMYWKNRHWHYWKIVLCLIDWVKKIEKGVFIIRNDSTSNLKKKTIFFISPELSADQTIHVMTYRWIVLDWTLLSVLKQIYL